MKLGVIARGELGKLLATRRGWLSLFAFALLWAGVLVYAVQPLTGWLAPATAVATPGDIASGQTAIARAVLDRLGLSALERWPSPQLALYWLIALYLLPPFALVVAADQSASDLARGTLRFEALRAGRATLFLGRLAGQLLVQLGLVLVTLASVLAIIARQLPERFADSLAVAPFVIAALLAHLLPFVALMAVCSALARSARQATLYALIAWIVVSIALALARDAFGPRPLFDHVLPGSESASLRLASGADVLAPALAVPLVQAAVLTVFGLLLFGRRDL